MKKNIDLVALGELLIDFTPINEGVYQENPGGAVSNVCSVFAINNMKSALISKVGDDYFGNFLKTYLENIGVDCSGVLVDKDHNTTLAFVSLDKFKDRKFTFFRNNSADVNLKKEDINPLIIKSSKIFHFGSLSLVNTTYKEATLFALKVAKDNNCLISFDPNYRDKIWSKDDFKKAVDEVIDFVDIIKVSKEEGEILTDFSSLLEISDELLKRVNSVIITLGEDGAYFANKEFRKKVDAYKAKTIDTTGAGDIFFGTFLCELVKSNFNEEKDNLIKLLDKANFIASISTETKGAIPSIPKFDN